MLKLFDKHGIKVTSFMIRQAVDKHPELAAEIVRRATRLLGSAAHRRPRLTSRSSSRSTAHRS
jgi:peptidoglycan/xylan/chitin deacetylase (PgdA/CDA1 family)